MSVGVDFDFARWIAARRGAVERQAREGVAYSFTGERAFRRTLMLTRPVMIAIEATTRLWRERAATDLLAQNRVNESQFPAVYRATKQASEALRVRMPTVFTTNDPTLTINALGLEDAPYLLVNPAFVDKLLAACGEPALVAAIGHELGHVQNGHVLYATALHYLQHSAAFFVRWAVQPAIITMQAWSRRADVTCDRAALLATRDVSSAMQGIVALAVGTAKLGTFDVDAYLRDLPDPAVAHRGIGKFAELFRSNPFVGKRITALKWFADSAYYAIALGQDAAGKPSSVEVDKKVADLISVF